VRRYDLELHPHFAPLERPDGRWVLFTETKPLLSALKYIAHDKHDAWVGWRAIAIAALQKAEVRT
jgi:hypothetical protein